MPIPRFHNKTSISGDKYLRPKQIIITIEEGLDAQVTLIADKVVEIDGKVIPLQSVQVSEVYRPDDLLDNPGVTSKPNNRSVQVPLINPVNGTQDGQITYEELFHIMLSLTKYLESKLS